MLVNLQNNIQSSSKNFTQNKMQGNALSNKQQMNYLSISNSDSTSFSGRPPKVKVAMREDFIALYKKLTEVFYSTAPGEKMSQIMGKGRSISVYPMDSSVGPVFACAVSSKNNAKKLSKIELRFLIRKDGIVDVQHIAKRQPNTVIEKEAEADLLINAVTAVIKKQEGRLKVLLPSAKPELTQFERMMQKIKESAEKREKEALIANVRPKKPKQLIFKPQVQIQPKEIEQPIEKPIDDSVKKTRRKFWSRFFK